MDHNMGISRTLLILLLCNAMSPGLFKRDHINDRHDANKKYAEQTLNQSNYNEANKCATKLPTGCSCSKAVASLGITCFRIGLKVIPDLKVGPTLVKTLNFEQNNLTTIDIGAFFGLKVERLLLSNNSIHSLNFLAFWGLEYHLETLDLSYNQFTEVPSNAIRLLRNLRSLSLTGNRITTLRKFDFGFLRRLEVLALDRNPISLIAEHTFTGTEMSLLMLDSIQLDGGIKKFPTGDLKLLKGLSLASNGITRFPKGWFQSLKSLKYLCLDKNKFKTLTEGTFNGIEKSLQTLELNDNKLRKIPREILQELPNLETLSLRGNKLHKIFPRTFNTSKLMQYLDLSKNKISGVSSRAFVGLDNIIRLDLRENNLITLDDRTFYWENPRGKEIYMSGNPWLCNCLLQWIKREFKRKTPLSQAFVEPLDMLCNRPNSLEGIPISRAHLKDFTCDHEYYYYEVRDEHDDTADFDNDYEEYDASREEETDSFFDTTQDGNSTRKGDDTYSSYDEHGDFDDDDDDYYYEYYDDYYDRSYPEKSEKHGSDKQTSLL